MGSDGVVWQRVWRSGRHEIRLGSCDDGRWVAWRSRGDQTVECWDERAACERVQRWMGRVRWVEVPDANRPSDTLVLPKTGS